MYSSILFPKCKHNVELTAGIALTTTFGTPRVTCDACEVDRLKAALGLIAELGERCDDCEPTEAPLATHVITIGIWHYLCGPCAESAKAAYRKAESKGCGKQPEVKEHAQDTAVLIAYRALGLLPEEVPSLSNERTKEISSK